MSVPIGLAGWEIVALSGMLAVSWLAIVSTCACAVAYHFTRETEPAVAAAPVSATPAPAVQPIGLPAAA
ncbi:MAG: hypothetical protein K2V38_10720 [Gemmataceae bacterium]|nr:hypothetical protein [Gemmataceae bacterium]